MIIYSCKPDWESMMTCLYEARRSGVNHQELVLRCEPIAQYTLFDQYVHVESDAEKAQKVMDAICRKISVQFYHELAFSSLYYEEDALDNVYRMMLLGFHHGPKALEMMQYRDVMRNAQIRKAMGTETCHFREFTRFHEIDEQVYVAHIEPRSRVLPAIAPHFADRMPSEHWMIVDDTHREAVVHPKNAPYYFRVLNDLEYTRLLATEEENDCYTDLWRIFFRKIAIEERTNPRCQTNHYPQWTRKHAVEFL